MKWFDSRADKPQQKKLILCPFHDEKTPSCVVDLVRGRYHCLGCGRVGPATELPEDE